MSPIRACAASAIVALALVGCAPGLVVPGANGFTPLPTTAPGGETDTTVLRVVDGDTIVVALGGAKGAKVRLIGIDTPEVAQCMYQAATLRMRALVDGKRVRLLRDVSETDRYGRLLRYVYAGDVFVNATMVTEGFAAAAAFPPDVAHARDFVALERAARIAKKGLWGPACAS